MPVALIVGATGLVGAHLIRKLTSAGDWKCIGLGRTPPRGLAHSGLDDFITADLTDTAASRSVSDRLAQVTHVFYLARVLGTQYRIPVQENERMLANMLDALHQATDLRHVQVMHGLKWYGSQARPFPVPARESDPRPDDVDTFYYAQRDLLANRQQGQPWTFSTLRPHCVSGVATGSPSNLMLGLGVYAALMRETGQPLRYPGSHKAFQAKLTYTDANLLANAMHWAATTPKAGNQDFNVANGDVFTWHELWPALAAYFQVREASPGVPDFVRTMHGLEPAWNNLGARTNLAVCGFQQLADWSFIEASLRPEWDQVMSTDKLAYYGFTQQTDTRKMVFNILDEYRRLRLLP